MADGNLDRMIAKHGAPTPRTPYKHWDNRQYKEVKRKKKPILLWVKETSHGRHIYLRTSQSV